MKIINIVLCALMFLFICVQYNDPDGLVWALIYSVAGSWAGVAGIRPEKVINRIAIILLNICIFIGVLLMFYFWPDTPQFWKKDVWWVTETAREGMGIMVANIVLLSASITVWRTRSKMSKS